VVQSTCERTGRLDYIFNNAGIAIGGSLSDYTIEDWDQILNVNLRGVINGIQAAFPIMIKQGFGHIVNTASMAGLTPSPGVVAYATTKYGVVGLSKSLRAEAASLGVRVSVICPGGIRTPILEGGGVYGKMLTEISPETMRRMLEKLRPMDPSIFAVRVLKQVARNTAVIIVPSWWKLFWWINRLSPVLGMHLAQWNFQKMQKELGITEED
jgi:NAD(P)-dependent dehydrogenase (short-subunit alcohol dehydrogenase family)